MTAIGGKTRKAAAPTKPQFVVQWALGTNRFAHFALDDKGHAVIRWIGDPNAATKFDSKFAAKTRVRDIEDVPESRVFKMLEVAR